MYENTFSETDAIKLDNIVNDGCGYCSCLQMDKDSIARQDELFELAEKWLNAKGITTRTSYNNVLPTYNLLIEIGKYIEEQNSKELKDCPFCGSHVEMKSDILGTPFGRYSYSSGYEFSIKCDECGCTTTECHTTTKNMTEEEAKAKVASAWNERHE